MKIQKLNKQEHTCDHWHTSCNCINMVMKCNIISIFRPTGCVYRSIRNCQWIWKKLYSETSQRWKKIKEDRWQTKNLTKHSSNHPSVLSLKLFGSDVSSMFKPGQNYQSKCRVMTVKHKDGTVMIWGAWVQSCWRWHLQMAPWMSMDIPEYW